LRATLDRRATEQGDAVMPGYTHLQRAQPVTLAYHLRAHAVALARAERRLTGAGAAAMKACPLGAGALAGSTLPLDRAAVAHALGFAAPSENTIDAVADRDFAATFLFACAMLAVTCSRLAEEIVLWTTSEFGFARLDDAWSTGSSLMPQKRNPDVAELARAKAGRLIGGLTGFLATLKALPLAYDRDLQEDKEPAFDANDSLAAMLPALAGLVATLRFDTERMRQAADDPALLATDLAEYLVAKGIPFREAHDAVGRLMRLPHPTLDDIRAAHAGFGDDVASLLDPSVSARRRIGG
jgi:argininosuccinate lyase